MSKQPPIPPAAGGATPEERPEPRPIRFYGTSWVDHSRGYTPRRFALGLGAMILAAFGALVLRMGYEGLRINETAGWLTTLVVVAFAVCSAIAFTRTWAGWNRVGAGADDPSFRSIKAVGFLGLLLAYALRSGIEAPGEGLRRREYEEELARWQQLTTRRSGNPARRARRRDGGR
ncbi:hypothetical protein [Streptomyces sp. ST2-7A]|uniref:hypothetical protein n=1 Tax=Streptomyces sp. ST2-7A TaxID=2907214 RepID=UPI001F1BABDF|nr:hypothetical protein [Streptomyces sp. ST2-7A]MCE7083195.1 hypothetical protein [Streptomyces sp. ST2-7A]